MSDSERLRDHQLGNIETGERLPDGLEADAKRWQEAKNAGALNYGDLKKVKEEYYLFDVLVLAEIDSRRISIRKLVDIGQQHRQLKITFRDAAKLSAKADEWPSFKVSEWMDRSVPVLAWLLGRVSSFESPLMGIKQDSFFLTLR